MGSKGSKSHQSINLSPTTAAADPVASAAVASVGPSEVFSSGEIDGGISVGVYEGVGGGGLGTITAPPAPPPAPPADVEEPMPEWQKDFTDAAAQWATVAGDPTLSGAEKYAALQEYGTAARAALKTAAGDPAADQLHAALKEDTQAFLTGLPKDELDDIASANGFEHPMLVSHESLAFWMDPAYSPYLPQKAKIQTAAANRYQQLLAGTIPDYKGVTLADVQQKTGGGSPPTTWTATPEEFEELSGDLAALTGKYHYNVSPATRAEAIALENRIVSAAVPGMDPGDLTAAKATATVQTSELLEKPSWSEPGPTNKALLDQGLLTADQAFLLDEADAASAARLSTPAATRVELADKTTERVALLDAFNTAVASVDLPAAQAALAGTAPLDLSTADGAAAFGQAWADYKTVADAAHALNTAVANGAPVPKFSWQAPAFAHPDAAAWPFPNYGSAAKGGAAGFREWAKTQPLAALRDAAATAGLSDPDKAATRADVQNYLLTVASPGGADQAASIQAAVDAKAEAKKAPKPPPAPKPTAGPAPTPAPTPAASSSPAPAAPAATGSHTAKLVLMQQRLAAYGAAAQAVPERVDDSTVAGLGFTDAPSHQQIPGGSHTKVTVVDQNGNRWLHKKGAPAQAEAEVAASKVFAAAGVAAPPVYRNHYAGIAGTVQPVVDGYSTLGGVGDLSQTDVDIIVRTMAVSWAIGDNDANEQNFVRTPPTATPTGEQVTGIVKIDNGQAGKFFGDPAEQLSTGWQPNANYGTPLIHQIVNASSSGGLPEGVRVDATAAVPVIKAIHAISDDDWRDMMRPVAEAGAKEPSTPWRARMVERAAARHAKPAPQVTEAEIADEFLDFAVARKHSTRDDVVAYFEENGVDTTPIVTTT